MKINKVCIVLGLVMAIAMFFELAAHADEINESTKFTFNGAVQIPGQVLLAGTYVFQEALPHDDPHVIQIFNADRTILYATLQTASADRAEPTGKTAITLAEPRTGDAVLVTWFYPGRVTGHEFVYSKEQEQKITHADQETFVGKETMSPLAMVGE
jgi:hypothetical protein